MISPVFEFAIIRGGQERCFTVVRKGSEQHVINPDGSLNTSVTQIR